MVSRGSRVGLRWWLILIAVGILYGNGFVDGVETQGAHRRPPRMSYVAKIVEEEKAKQIKMPGKSQAAAESDEEGDDSTGSGSSDTEEEEGNVVGLPGKENKSGGKSGDKAKKVASRSDKGGHNWYVYNNNGNMQGRSFGGKDGAGGLARGNKRATPKVPAKGGVGDNGGAGGGAGDATKAGGAGGGTGAGAGSADSNKKGGAGGDGGAGAGTGASSSDSKKKGGGGGAAGGAGGSNSMKNPFKVVRARPSDQVDPSGYNFFQFNPKSKLGWLWLSRTRPGESLQSRLNLVGKDDGGMDIDDMDPANEFNWESRRYDRACLYLEYQKKKSDVKIPLVSEEIKRLVDVQNPHQLTFKFLQGIVSIFTEKVCKNASSYEVAAVDTAPFGLAQKALLTGSVNPAAAAPDTDSNFLPPLFVNNLFSLFLVLRNMTSSPDSKDYPAKEDDEIIFEKLLKQCNETEPSVLWFYHSCGDQLLSSDQYNNFACTPFVDYDFNVKKYDPILDGIWHMFNAVHSFCFTQFKTNPRMWHKLALIIANAFTPEMRLRWKASVASQKFYMRLLGPEYPTYLETINRCTFAASLRSDAPFLLPRFDSPSITTFGMKEGADAESKPKE